MVVWSLKQIAERPAREHRLPPSTAVLGMVEISSLASRDGLPPLAGASIIAGMSGSLGERWTTDRDERVTGRILEAAGLPPFLQAVMRPWVAAVETGTLGMRDTVVAAASSTAANLKRRVVVVPALDLAISQAIVATVAFAQELDKRDAAPTKPRAEALAALVAVIVQLRTAEPNEDTRALGLGW